MLSVYSVIGAQEDDTGANDKCHRQCTLSQPLWVISFELLSLRDGERDLDLSSCFRSLTSPHWAAGPGGVPRLWPVNFLYLRLSSGRKGELKASWGRSCAPQLHLPMTTPALFPQGGFSQGRVTGHECGEGRGQGEHTGESRYLVCGSPSFLWRVLLNRKKDILGREGHSVWRLGWVREQDKSCVERERSPVQVESCRKGEWWKNGEKKALEV